jgi:diaminopimelate decarboxylase
MKHWKDLSVNEKAHLMLGGCDAVELAKQFGTPLYVMEEDTIRSVCRGYVEEINKYAGGGKVMFASKAFLNTAMCRIVQSEGMGIDVASGGELFIALKAGFDPQKIYFHGNVKTLSDLTTAVEAGIGHIVIDSVSEIDTISDIAASLGRAQDVSLRLKPGIEAHTHDYIKTGQMDSKFGFGISDGEGMRIVKAILERPGLNLVGMHCHIGSQVFELTPFRDTVDVMLDFLLEVKNETGFVFSEINFGGGYGIHYLASDKPLRPEQYVHAMHEELERLCAQKGIDTPVFAIEPGRSIVGEAGTTLYTIGDIKTVPGIRTYASVDGGMADNPRVALYQAEYTCALAGRMNEPDEAVVSIAGRCCESGDMLVWNAQLPEPKAGDVLAMFSTGAYTCSMASNYNKLPVPAVVLVKDGKAELMVRRQTYEQLIENDVMPSWL